MNVVINLCMILVKFLQNLSFIKIYKILQESIVMSFPYITIDIAF
ncbi:hypothetical protein FDB72_11260 [Clostridium botulinum]|nr:hypothetical protein CLB_0125 [Clostridium botulinum A str. ATCC 19397]ABS36467.1 hypothetical protein CLC_0137 [Clostridium botulinum A str. Hall]AUM93179.1 hypothetical protein RSJ5_00590 [Clostridium botulinum]PIH03968.1 hypothetical protein CS538_10905 [Clostridium combesii]AWB19454.1 hypothetical protein DB732_00625 [Clostridium botulinum]